MAHETPRLTQADLERLLPRYHERVWYMAKPKWESMNPTGPMLGWTGSSGTKIASLFAGPTEFHWRYIPSENRFPDLFFKVSRADMFGFLQKNDSWNPLPRDKKKLLRLIAAVLMDASLMSVVE